jgi:chromosome partitioning protein
MAEAAEIVALCQPNGSSAKSTTGAAIAHLEAEAGRRVLMVGLDPQGNLTSWFSADRDTAGITQALQSANVEWPGVPAEEVKEDLRRSVRRTIQHTRFGVDVIAEDVGLRHTVQAWNNFHPDRRDYLLADVLASIEDLYDLVLLDCKGDLGVTTMAALRGIRPSDASDRVTHAIGVCLPESKSVVGLTTLQGEIETLVAEGERVELAAVIPAKIQHRSRSADADDIYQWMRETYATIITPPIRKAPSMDGAYNSGEPITAFDPSSPVSEDIRTVVRFLQDRKVLP